MDSVREKWTDERLDDLNERVGGLAGEMRAGFARIDERFDRMQAQLLTGFIALVGLILTQG